MQHAPLAQWFDQADMNDTSTVGGKGASLGEMFQKLTTIGVKVPNGFTLTTEAFQRFITADIPEATWKNVGAPEEVDDLLKDLDDGFEELSRDLDGPVQGGI